MEDEKKAGSNMSTYYTDPHQNPYWQNLNGNQGNNANENAGQTGDPNWHPEPEYGRQLGRTAAIVALVGLLSTIIMPVFVPMILGGIAIVLAILSKGKEPSFTNGARRAITIGIISIVMNIALLIACIYGIHMILHDPETRAEANSMMESMYGYSFDDLIQQIMDQYGIDIQSGTMPIPESQMQSAQGEVL